jgi:phage N-6-adenine-methyltransferase
MHQPQNHWSRLGDPEDRMSGGAAFHRGTSKQDYQTPEDFLTSVVLKFGELQFDLSASGANTVCGKCFIESEDSLIQDWHLLDGPLWLNPPFSRIGPWAKKCYEESRKGAEILLLVPAAVGSNWFQKWVHDKSMVYFLNPRLSFDGKNSYPKDCLLSAYNMLGVGYDCWKWKGK